jgi:hypothetical protein
VTHGTRYAYNKGCRCGECRGRIADDARKWRANNVEKQRAYDARRRGTHNREHRSAQLKCLYGITLEEWEALCAAQGGCCAICHRERRLDVDHCHESGKVRGLLCRRCNLMLGQCGDDSDLLIKAADYLSR